MGKLYAFIFLLVPALGLSQEIKITYLEKPIWDKKGEITLAVRTGDTIIETDYFINNEKLYSGEFVEIEGTTLELKLVYELEDFKNKEISTLNFYYSDTGNFEYIEKQVKTKLTLK